MATVEEFNVAWGELKKNSISIRVRGLYCIVNVPHSDILQAYEQYSKEEKKKVKNTISVPGSS